jgi:ERCC4-type nuclease
MRSRAWSAADVGSVPVNPKAPFILLVDTREQKIPPLPEGVLIERVTMSEADYSTKALQGRCVIERKSLTDFAGSLSWSRERFDDMVGRLKNYEKKCIVVEGDLTALYRVTDMHPHAIIGSCASFIARYDCPVIFAGNAAGAGRFICGILKRWEQELMGVIE